jgi:hypothetical protein
VKKLLVVLMAVAMTVSVASSAMAADLSYWMGGDFYYFFTTADGDRGFNQSTGTFTVDSLLTARIQEGNTWAQMWYFSDTWNYADDDRDGQGSNNLRYAFGIDNIGGSTNIGFSTKDTGIANIAQNPLGELFNDFKADPVFNTFDMPGALSLAYNSDSFTLKAEAVVVDDIGFAWRGKGLNGFNEGDARKYAVSGAFKFDGGDVHFGYKKAEMKDDALILIGSNFMAGDVAVKLDFYLDEGSLGNFGEVGAAAGNSFQGNVAWDRFDVTLFYNMPEADAVDDILGLGFNFKATDKLSVGLKYFDNVTDNIKYTPAVDSVYEVYGLYDMGAFDVKFGVVDDFRLSDDLFFLVGVHASIW